MESGHHPLVELAWSTIVHYVRARETILPPEELTPEMEQEAGTFVSLHKHGALRGCIGTFEPTCPNVAQEIIQNAISAATRDWRFPPVQASELGDLEISVDVLSLPEPIESIAELDPKRYGVIVQSGGRRGLLLPDLEGVDTAEYQVEVARRKARIGPREPVQLYRFEVKRYHEKAEDLRWRPHARLGPRPRPPLAARGTLPGKCPNCGAPIKPDEVKWFGRDSAECPHCGTVVTAQPRRGRS